MAEKAVTDANAARAIAILGNDTSTIIHSDLSGETTANDLTKVRAEGRFSKTLDPVIRRISARNFCGAGVVNS